MEFNVRIAGEEELSLMVQMALELWPGHTAGELSEEYAELLRSPEAAVFLAYAGDVPAGFAQCQLRHDYVEGTTSSPVGYLEGIWIRPEFRRRGGARQLLARCEDWAIERGCREFASDCELDNTDSLRFHLKAGFREANRIICFHKALGEKNGNQ